MNALSLIPQPQLETFARLRDAAKQEFFAWADAVMELQQADQENSPLTPVYEKIAAKLSCSARSVRRRFSDWLNGTAEFPAGDWRILVPKYWLVKADDACAEGAVVLRQEFVDFWRGLCGDNQRKCRPQRRALLRRLVKWRAGDPTAAIPGYDAPPADAPGKDHPAGWSERNLYRPLATPQTRVELALQRIGTAAAIATLPSIPGTRVGVRFLEYLMFDDVWLDRKIVVPGYPNPVRLLQLGCLDYASGVYLKFGQRPELPTDNGTRDRLKERDMKWLVAMILEQWGFPRDYDMHLVLEHGTATLREHDCRALYDWSGGRIKPCYSTMEGQLVLAWEERGKGNPRAKAALESWHNLFHNEAGALVGQVGKDRDHSPAALLGMEREARALSTAGCMLSPADRARLRFPFADREQAHRETLEIVQRINSRTDHDCEGFESLLEWRLKGLEDEPWRHESLLPAVLASCGEAAVADTLVSWRSRKESPIERLQRLAANVPRGTITPGLLCKFYEDNRVVRALEPNGLFKFTQDGKEYLFAPASSVDSVLKPGVRYLLHFAPVDPPHVHITDEAGAYVATWPRVRRIQRGDHKALSAAIAEKQAQLQTAVANVRRRKADFIAAEEQRIRQNLEVINQSTMLSDDASPRVPQSRDAMASTLVDAYQAEADLARERARTKQILEGRAMEGRATASPHSVDDFLSDLNPQPSNQQQPSVTDDELNSIL